MAPSDRWETLNAAIVACRLCLRLVAHREAAAAAPPRRFRGQTYWARPLPGFGDRSARVVVVGLAPAAHGGNRTGRIFTGDESGNWLFRALFETGFANQPTSASLQDGLTLRDAFVTACVRCAPPGNKPSTSEAKACLPYLERELRLLRRATVLVALGGFAWQGVLRAFRDLGRPLPAPVPRFAHRAEVELAGGLTLLGSYHPSQQNTFTGRLTRPMLRAVFERARERARRGPAGS